jgi:hypothetical protein
LIENCINEEGRLARYCVFDFVVWMQLPVAREKSAIPAGNQIVGISASKLLRSGRQWHFQRTTSWDGWALLSERSLVLP